MQRLERASARLSDVSLGMTATRCSSVNLEVPLDCSNALPEDVHGAVGSAFLHPERSLVLEARALSHYSGEPSWKKADYSNLDCRPARMPDYGP
jgi:hypothetical protein